MAIKGVQGIVIAQGRDGDRVKVRIFRNNTCANCNCVLKDSCDPSEPSRAHRGIFDLFSDRSALEIEALNRASAGVGDRCLVKLRDDRSLVKGSFLVYLLPGMLFLAGLFLGGWLGRLYGLGGDGEVLAQLGGGLALLGAGYAFAKLTLTVKSGRYIPEVVEVVRPAEGPRPA